MNRPRDAGAPAARDRRRRWPAAFRCSNRPQPAESSTRFGQGAERAVNGAAAGRGDSFGW